LKTCNEGIPSDTPKELLKELLPIVERFRESGNAVSMAIVPVKLL